VVDSEDVLSDKVVNIEHRLLEEKNERRNKITKSFEVKDGTGNEMTDREKVQSGMDSQQRRM